MCFLDCFIKKNWDCCSPIVSQFSSFSKGKEVISQRQDLNLLLAVTSCLVHNECLFHELLIKCWFSGCAWWHVPLIWGLRKMDLWVWDQPSLLNEFQDSQRSLCREKFIFSYKVNNIENDLFKWDISSCDVTCNAGK